MVALSFFHNQTHKTNTKPTIDATYMHENKKQVFADCSTDNVGISAVWSAFTGFIFLGWWRAKRSGEDPLGPRGGGGAAASAGGGEGEGQGEGGGVLSSYAALTSMSVWAVVCIYYAVVEEAITTVAHAVSFAVGLGAWVLFEWLHQIPAVDSVGGGYATMPPQEHLRDG